MTRSRLSRGCQSALEIRKVAAMTTALTKKLTAMAPAQSQSGLDVVPAAMSGQECSAAMASEVLGKLPLLRLVMRATVRRIGEQPETVLQTLSLSQWDLQKPRQRDRERNKGIERGNRERKTRNNRERDTQRERAHYTSATVITAAQSHTGVKVPTVAIPDLD